MGRRQVVAWVAVLSSVAALVFVAWVAVLPPPGPEFDESVLSGWFEVVDCGIGVPWALMGALLVTLRPRNMLGWLILGVGVVQPWSTAAIVYATYGEAASWPFSEFLGIVSPFARSPSS